jgi:long-subunit acyl-CoA synthetase (AMP-forming)
LCALITGPVPTSDTQKVIEAVNADLPHYRQIRNFLILPGVFTAEDGLLTANGKLRRDAIERRYSAEIATMYSGKSA